MSKTPDLFDAAILFRRIRRWVPSGIGMMPLHVIRHQMGGRPGVDPYGWKLDRIDSAFQQLCDEGSIKEGGACGEYVISQQGIEKYELERSA